jgi:hypothetical protein
MGPPGPVTGFPLRFYLPNDAASHSSSTDSSATQLRKSKEKSLIFFQYKLHVTTKKKPVKIFMLLEIKFQPKLSTEKVNFREMLG